MKRLPAGRLVRVFTRGANPLRMLWGTLALGPAASAWAVDDANVGIQEVTVTATKQGALNIQDVPIAVQAISGDQLAAMGALQIGDYAALIPGFSFQDNGPGDKRYAIRGVSSTGAGTVGVYLDDVVITGENSQDGGGQQPDIALFDMDRIEVLKGPQGTTFGASSMTGTIRFITAKPSLTEFGGTARAAVISTSQGGTGDQVDGEVNLPLVSGVFAIRLAGFSLDEPGFISNQFEKDANEVRERAGRISAKLALTDALTVNGMVMVQETASDAIGYYNTTNNDGSPITQPGFYQSNLAREPESNRMAMYNFVVDYKTGYGTYTVSASRLQRDFHYTRDSSQTIATFLGLDETGDGRSVIDYPKTRSLNSYEARFVSGWDGPLQLLVGVNDQEEIRNFRSHVLTADPNGFVPSDPTILLDRTVHDELSDKAIFSEVSYAFTDQWKLTLGGRAYDNRVKESSDALTGFGGGAGAGPGPTDRLKDTGVIGKFNLSYKPSKNVLAYAEVSQGFRSGGVNDQTAAAIAHVSIPAGFGSDSLLNYELGLKTSWLDNMIVANGAAYFINWSKIQVQDLATSGTSSFPYTGNAGAAHIKGVELELQAAPIKGLRLALYGNYNQAELVEDSPIPANGLKGDEIPYVPQTTVTFNSDYDWALPWKELKATAGFEEAYTSSRNSQLRTDNPAFIRFPAYAIATLRAGVKSGNWMALLSVQNVFNNTSTIADTSVTSGLSPPASIPNRPRTMMLSVSTSF